MKYLLNTAVFACLLPRPPIRTVDWAKQYVSMAPGSEIKGKFRIDLVPHMEEPLDCFDDPEIDKITVQAASRGGKTVFGQVCMAKTAATNPHTMALADADEKATKRVINRTWKMYELIEPLAKKMPPRHLRSSEEIRLLDSLTHGCWSGSPSTAADFAAMLIVLNEIDKMSHRKSTEADFAYLMEERAKGFKNSKIIQISTPSLAENSRIEKARLEGDNRGRYVPCPHCNHFQTLRTGNGKSPGGLRWQKKKNGTYTSAIALETAWYECEKCKKKILDEHRYEMLNAGRWVKEGQKIDKRGRISGKPVRPGRHASFGPLGTHHSLLPSITWGVIARTYVEATKDRSRKKLRHFMNSWEGVTWDPKPVKISPHHVVERLGCDEPARECPEWTKFLTVSVDVGRVGNELIFYWGVQAWGLHQRGSLVDCGITIGESEFIQKMSSLGYPHADGGPSMIPVRVGIDSSDGVITNRIYKICENRSQWWPIKGSPTSNFSEIYSLGYQAADVPEKVLKARKKAGLGDLLNVNSQRSQEWIEDLVTGITHKESKDWFSIPVDFFNADPDLPQQLLNDHPIEQRLKSGRTICVWEKTGENEWRDVLRYGWVLAWHYTRHGRHWNQLVRISNADQNSPKKPKKRKKRQSPDVELMGGWQ